MGIFTIMQNLRKELGLTLKEVADYVGVSESTVQRWESGNIKNLRHEKIIKLAEVLKTTPARLMGWDVAGKTAEQIAKEDAAIIQAYHHASPEIQQAILRILKDQ